MKFRMTTLSLSLLMAALAAAPKPQSPDRSGADTPKASKAGTSHARKTASPKRDLLPAEETPSKKVLTLPVHKVVLYSNGVGYVERRGTVTENAEVSIPVPPEQFDDVWRTLMVADHGGGKISSLRANLPPLQKDIPTTSLDIQAFTDDKPEEGGFSGLLPKLQGSRIRAFTVSGVVEGRILNLNQQAVTRETTDSRTQQTTKETHGTQSLLLVRDDGQITSLDLASIHSVLVLDEAIRQDVKTFATLQEASRLGSKIKKQESVVVASKGEGRRDISVSYAQAAAPWETSYRLLLDQSGRPFLQGWIQVINPTDEDWQNIRLSLISGDSTIHLKQPAVDLTPARDAETRAPSRASSSTAPSVASGTRSGSYQLDGVDNNNTSSITQNQNSARAQNTDYDVQSMVISGMEPEMSEAVTGSRSGVEGQANVETHDQLFEYQIPLPVTVEHRQRGMVPFFQGFLEGERITLITSSQPSSPSAGLRIHNNSKMVLAEGPVTIYEGDTISGTTYLKETQPGQKPFLLFGSDSGTSSERIIHSLLDPAFLAKVEDGVLSIHYYRIESNQYKIRNKSKSPRVVYVHHSYAEDQELDSETQKPVVARSHSRLYRLELPPGKEAILELSLKEKDSTTHHLETISSQEIASLDSQHYLTPVAKQTLESIVGLRQKIEAMQKEDQELDKMADTLKQNREELKNNVKDLGDKSDTTKPVVEIYVRKLTELEGNLDKIVAQRKAIAENSDRLRQELKHTIETIQWETHLNSPAPAVTR